MCYAMWLQVCPSLAESQQNEKQAISTMFEREFKQEKNLEARSVAHPLISLASRTQRKLAFFLRAID
jgi:hypothetical protein